MKKPTTKSGVMPSVIRTGQGLRDALFDEIDLIRTGDGDRRRAMAVAALAGRVMDTVKVEIEYAKQASLAASPAGEAHAIGSMKLGRG
jgi:hypothetical protein